MGMTLRVRLYCRLMRSPHWPASSVEWCLGWPIFQYESPLSFLQASSGMDQRCKRYPVRAPERIPTHPLGAAIRGKQFKEKRGVPFSYLSQE